MPQATSLAALTNFSPSFSKIQNPGSGKTAPKVAGGIPENISEVPFKKILSEGEDRQELSLSKNPVATQEMQAVLSQMSMLDASMPKNVIPFVTVTPIGPSPVKAQSNPEAITKGMMVDSLVKDKLVTQEGPLPSGKIELPAQMEQGNFGTLEARELQNLLAFKAPNKMAANPQNTMVSVEAPQMPITEITVPVEEGPGVKEKKSFFMTKQGLSNRFLTENIQNSKNPVLGVNSLNPIINKEDMTIAQAPAKSEFEKRVLANIRAPRENIELPAQAQIITPEKINPAKADYENLRHLLHGGIGQLGSFGPKSKDEVGGLNIGDLKSVDLNKNMMKSIDEITQAISMNAAKNSPRVEVTLKHEQLGDMKILVEKSLNPSSPEKVDIQITSFDKRGEAFFKENQGELMKALNTSGVKVGHLDFDGRSSKDDMNKNFQQQNNGSALFTQDRNSPEGDSRRRQEMWDRYLNGEVA